MAGETRPYDDLEPPGVHTRLTVMTAIGVLVFLAVAISGLLVFYRLTLGSLPATHPRRFPPPGLETDIDPRTLAGDAPGPVQANPPHPPRPDEAVLRQAMAAIAAKGARAYDPQAAAGPRSGTTR